jgi:transposase
MITPAHTPFTLSPEERQRLETAVRSPTASQRLARRSRIVLLLAEGLSDSEVARRTKTCRATIARWRERVSSEGIARLDRDQAGRGRKRTTLTPEKIKEIVDATRLEKPSGQSHWSLRTMARRAKVAPSTVHEVWQTHQLQPHRVERWKLSLDPDFGEKLADVVGLYLNPPEKALVVSIDEKSQIQALERSQPILPLRDGLPERQTCDYTRHGTTSLFAALNILDGQVTGKCYPRHTHEEFLSFLGEIYAAVPETTALHVIVDNYATHKHQAVKQWLADHPTVTLHFTPTRCSWANLVERFFSELTTRRIRRESYRSVAEVEQAIREYVAFHNEQRSPYIWKKSYLEILQRINRCYRN